MPKIPVPSKISKVVFPLFQHHMGEPRTTNPIMSFPATEALSRSSSRKREYHVCCSNGFAPENMEISNNVTHISCNSSCSSSSCCTAGCCSSGTEQNKAFRRPRPSPPTKTNNNTSTFNFDEAFDVLNMTCSVSTNHPAHQPEAFPKITWCFDNSHGGNTGSACSGNATSSAEEKEQSNCHLSSMLLSNGSLPRTAALMDLSDICQQRK